MVDTYIKIAEDLLSYQEFWGVFRLFQASLWITVVVIIAVIIMHILYMLGYQTPLYRHRSPRARWSKQFFRGAGMVLGLILLVQSGLEWAAVTIEPAEKKKTVLSGFLEEMNL